MKRLIRTSLVSCVAALSVVAAAGGAGASHVIDIGDTAALVTKGAGVVVPIEVTCEPTPFPPFPFPGGSAVSVSVSQRHGSRIASGGATAPAVCDGTAHTVEVLITAYEAPFHHGPALVIASMFSCDSSGCHEPRVIEEIDIEKA